MWPGGDIGRCWDVDNSGLVPAQLQLLLALKRDHPLVAALLEDSSIKPETFNAQPLIDAKVATGTKILDMGCGSWRAFARAATDLGADVYTVSLEPFASPPYFHEYPEATALAKERHLQLDLRRPDALDIIRFMFGDHFDLVTHAHLDTARGPSAVVEKMALSLLKNNGGIYFDSPGSPQCYITRPAPVE